MIKKYKYFLLSAAVLAGIMYWLIYGGDLITFKSVATQLPNAIIKNANFSEDKDGKRSWELAADQVEVDSGKNINILTGVKGKLYRADGTVVDVKAKGGIYNMTTKEVQLKGDVLAVYSGGGTLKCEEITWAPAGNSIVATGKVEIKNDRFEASGDKIETDRELIKMKITGNGMVQRGGQQ